MRAVKRFAFTILLSVLAGTDCICFLWLLTLCGSAYEKLDGQRSYIAALVTNGDFWIALLLFLLTSFALAAVALLLRRERKLRRAEVEQEKICENETEWEAQP